jgi:hypothetical protein
MSALNKKPARQGVIRGLGFRLNSPSASARSFDSDKGADLSIDSDKGADLSLDSDKGADLNIDFDKGADLAVLARSVDSALKPLEALLARLEHETAVLFASPGQPSSLDRLNRFESDSGGVGVVSLLADIRGYVDELRTAVAEPTASSEAGGSPIVQGIRRRGATIRIVVQ